MSPTQTPSLPQKKLKTISPKPTPTLDLSPQTTSSTLLKKKREECIKDMIRLNNKWTYLNNKFKDIAVAKIFRKKDSTTTLYLYHFHRRLYNLVTKEILLVIVKERNLQKRTILPFGTLSPHYHTLRIRNSLKDFKTSSKDKPQEVASRHHPYSYPTQALQEKEDPSLPS